MSSRRNAAEVSNKRIEHNNNDDISSNGVEDAAHDALEV